MKDGDVLAPGTYTRINPEHGMIIGDATWIDHPDTGRRVVATVEGVTARLVLAAGARDVTILCGRFGPGINDRIALIDAYGRLLVQPG